MKATGQTRRERKKEKKKKETTSILCLFPVTLRTLLQPTVINNRPRSGLYRTWAHERTGETFVRLVCARRELKQERVIREVSQLGVSAFWFSPVNKTEKRRGLRGGERDHMAPNKQ